MLSKYVVMLGREGAVQVCCYIYIFFLYGKLTPLYCYIRALPILQEGAVQVSCLLY